MLSHNSNNDQNHIEPRVENYSSQSDAERPSQEPKIQANKRGTSSTLDSVSTHTINPISPISSTNTFDMREPEPQGTTDLHEAVKRSDHLEVAKLINNRQTNLNAIDSTGNTPLHYSSDEVISKMLMHQGANPNITNLYGINAFNCMPSKIRNSMFIYYLTNCSQPHKGYFLDILWHKDSDPYVIDGSDV